MKAIWNERVFLLTLALVVAILAIVALTSNHNTTDPYTYEPPVVCSQSGGPSGC